MATTQKGAIPVSNTPKIIWTAEAIGKAIGRSADFVRRTLIDMPNSPVHRFGNRYWAYEDDLQNFFEHMARKSG